MNARGCAQRNEVVWRAKDVWKEAMRDECKGVKG